MIADSTESAKQKIASHGQGAERPIGKQDYISPLKFLNYKPADNKNVSFKYQRI